MKKVVFLFLVLAFSACKKTTNTDPVPEITFNKFVKYADAAGKDTAVDFVFTIKDGDGDIGSPELDTSCSAQNENLYVFYEEKRGSDFFQKMYFACDTNPCDKSIVVCDSFKIDFSRIIPYVPSAGNTNSLEAEITYHLDELSALIAMSPSGRFRFYFRDRAGHFSNELYTPQLDLNR